MYLGTKTENINLLRNIKASLHFKLFFNDINIMDTLDTKSVHVPMRLDMP